MRVNGLTVVHTVGAVCMWLGVATFAVADMPVHEERPLDNDASVYVDNIKGSIVVKGWDKPKVLLEGRLGDRVNGLEVSGDEDNIRFEVDYPRGIIRRAGESHLELFVPHGVSLKLEGVSSYIKVYDVHGEIDVEAVSGSIHIESNGPDIHAESTSGSVKIFGEAREVEASSVSGSIEIRGALESIRAETVSGSITIDAPVEELKAETVSGSIKISQAAGEVDAESVSGSVRVDGREFDDCRLVSCSGSIQWSGALKRGGDLNLDTHSGTVKLSFDEEPSAEIQMESFNGSLKASFPDAGNFSGRKHLRFKVGSGDGEIKVHTFSGSVDIKSR